MAMRASFHFLGSVLSELKRGSAAKLYLGKPVSVPDKIGMEIANPENKRYSKRTFLTNARINRPVIVMRLASSSTATLNSCSIGDNEVRILRYRYKVTNGNTNEEVLRLFPNAP